MACGDHQLENNAVVNGGLVVPDATPQIGLSIYHAMLKASGDVTFIPTNSIYVQPPDSLVYSQVLVVLENTTPPLNMAHVRVVFDSDRAEWVSAGLGSYHYDDEDMCLSSGTHCDEVRPAEGVSGAFLNEGFGRWISLNSIYCASFSSDYHYNVIAYVVDISGPSPKQISNFAYMTISCIMD